MDSTAVLPIKGKKLPAILGFAERQLLAQNFHRQGAVLKSALGEDRHLEAGYRHNTSRNNLSFQRIKPRNAVVSEIDKRNCLRYRNHRRPRKRTEAVKTILMSWSVSARVGPAQSPAVGERMLDLSDTPTLLIQHRVVDHAANCKFGGLLDRVIL